MAADTEGQIQQTSDDLLWRQLKSVPAFRALLRAVEARFYQAIDFPEPILDLGCGDGNFAELAFDQPITAGIDPWWGPLQKARRGSVYDLPLQALGDQLPFADQTFGSAFSNSVLEHIPDIQPVLNETARVLKAGAPFVLTVPSDNFTTFLGGADYLNRLGLAGAAGMYQTWFNRISRHAHTDPPQVWAERLAEAGFLIERWQYYFSEAALRTLELGHAQGLPSAVLHALTGHWILGPWESNLRRTEAWVRPYYEEPFPQDGAYLFFLARKLADPPVESRLPDPQAFTVAELEALRIIEQPIVAQTSDAGAAADMKVRSQRTEETLQTASEEPESSRLHLALPALLVALTLFLAFLGQSALRAAPGEPSGMRWFALGGLVLLLLLWHQRRSRAPEPRPITFPRLSDIPRRRWLYIPAILLAFVAYSLASADAYLSPLLPILTWISGAALAWYALSPRPFHADEAQTDAGSAASLTTIKASILLFLIALLPRLIDLARHPFILNGTEASMGLEALNVLKGLVDNPFGSGWLTNPNLPFLLQAVPVRLLGPTTVAIRLPSALIGALTVPVLFVIGQRLFGRTVALVAAVLLAGSHFHIHYSRSGLTNAWDALLVLLVLGQVAIAWTAGRRQSGWLWLGAGLAAGLSMYLYTSAHLLPIMLGLLALILFILDRPIFREQWRGALAMIGLALVIALPQLLHYQAATGVYMERANTLGILANQSGWLVDEAARTGLSQGRLLLDQFWRSALAFNATIDTGTSYGPKVPLLNFVFGLLAVLGFFVALARVRQIRFSILIVWLLVTILFAGTLLVNPPNSHRLIIAMPAVSLLAAVALAELFALLVQPADEGAPGQSATRTHRAHAMYLVIILGISAAIAASDIFFYFSTYRSNHEFADRNTEIADGVANYLNTLPGEWTAYFYGPPTMYVDFPTIPYLASEFTAGSNLFNVFEAETPVPDAGTQNQTHIFLPERTAELESLRSRYPSGTEHVQTGYYADPLFIVYEVRDN